MSAASPSPELVDNWRRDFTRLGEEIGKLIQTRQKLSIQLNENEGVQKELALLSGNKAVSLYRALGPALVMTDYMDAKSLIDGRCSKIKGDLQRIEEQVVEKGEKRKDLHGKITAAMGGVPPPAPVPASQLAR